MKRWLTALLAVICLLVPSTASAVPFHIVKHGTGLRGAYPNNVYGSEKFAAAVAPFHLRVVLDKCQGDNPLTGSSGQALDDIIASGITVLPVVMWTSPCGGNAVIPSTTTLQAQWQSYVQNAVNAVNFLQGAHGVPQTNVIEVWNEPNGNIGGRLLLGDYFNWIYNPARAGARAADADVGTLFGGMCFGTSANQADNCRTDATTWINAVHTRGYTGINGFAIHPYGLTDGAGNRNGARTVSQAINETGFACAASTFNETKRSLWITETGWPSSLPGGEQAQSDWLTTFRNFAVGKAAVLTNWIGKSQSNTGAGSIGLINADNDNGKIALGTWDAFSSGAYDGDTNTPCQ